MVANELAVVWWEYAAGLYRPWPSPNCEGRDTHLLRATQRARLSKLLAPNGGHGLRFLGSCAFHQHALDLKRISRLLNPSLRFHLVSDEPLVNGNAYYAAALRQMNVSVHFRRALRTRHRKGNTPSRATRYEELHRNETLHPPQRHQAEMLSRFCEIADLAADEGLKRVLILDADAGLFADARRAFRPFLDVDVVAPCSTCSQDTLWSVRALDRFCDGLVGFWHQSPAVINRLFRKFGVSNKFNDMDYLSMFVASREFDDTLAPPAAAVEIASRAAAAPPLSHRLLAIGKPSSHNPSPLAWLPGITLDRLALKEDPSGASSNTRCQRALDRISFSTKSTRKVPLATLREDGAAVPIIHFQGVCKEEVVHAQVYEKVYASTFAQSHWALTPHELRHHQSWWNALLPRYYDWRR